MRRFKVLGTKEKCSIPWTVIAPHEGQAICNHGQDLEMLKMAAQTGVVVKVFFKKVEKSREILLKIKKYEDEKCYKITKK